MPLLGQRDTIRTGVDLVVIPVTVKGSNGEFVYGLKKEDFTIFEDGKLQEIRQFSFDQSSLSVAVLLDTAVDGDALRSFMDSIIVLSSAFTDNDEIEVYRFDRKGIVKLSDFTASRQAFQESLPVVEGIVGRRSNWGSSLVLFPERSSRWLRSLLDRNADTRVLNEALLAAAEDLQNRGPNNRKIIIAISDEHTAKNTSLREIRDQLIRYNIQFYGVTVGMPLTEGLISALQTYAYATGGDVYSGKTGVAMQTAFAQITERSRHEYVLAYVSNNEISDLLPVMRQIEVQTRTPGLKINHRSSYWQYPQPEQPSRKKDVRSAAVF
jgi:VWFA-related protein